MSADVTPIKADDRCDCGDDSIIGCMFRSDCPDPPMDRVGETRWIDDPKLPSQILSTPIVSTPATDYIKAEAERLSNDTAARFLAALDAMESDSDMNVKRLDSDKDVTSGLHARSKRLELSTPDALGQRDEKQSHVLPTFVTITISRDDAERWASDDDHIHATAWGPVDKAIRACVPVATGSSRSDKIRAVAQQAHDDGDCVCCLPDPDTITVTISRDCAEYFAERACDNEKDCFEQFGGCASKDCHLEHACRAALEGER